MTPLTHLRRVEVEWLDSVTEGGWMYTAEARRKAQAETMICRNVGYVLDETDRYLLLVEGYMSNGDSVLGLVQIPRVAILDVVGLKDADD